MTSVQRRVIALASLLGASATAHADVTQSKHNLSATGPGPVTSSSTSEVCVFCHIPHNANPSRALWNRQAPGTNYTLYQSSTLEATLQQPTGSSRLCLSCHDGTVALGALRVAPSSGPVGLGPLTGSAVLGSDLSDDHPVSFVYDTRLSARRDDLVDPAGLSRRLPLDADQQLQCTTCHDPHVETQDFLRMETRFSALCTACHAFQGWQESSHATSTAASGTTGVWSRAPATYPTVGETGCQNCHRSHAAPHPWRLLASTREVEVCMACHNGSVAAKNLEPELVKVSAHPIASSNWTHDPTEDPRSMPRHVSCVDCHQPHAVTHRQEDAPGAAVLPGVSGVTLDGTLVSAARADYEVCLKCHGIRDQATPGIIRQDNTRNVRVEIDPNNASYHPVAAVGRDAAMDGLALGLTSSSLVTCLDCHTADEAEIGGSRVRGPHGSRYAPLLAREYQQGDPVMESPQTAALCYTCHRRDALLASSPFPHEAHLRQSGGASCAVCHDAHGSRQSIRLINLMRRDATGHVVVEPNRQGQLVFLSTRQGGGTCSLSCHGVEHHNRRY